MRVIFTKCAFFLGKREQNHRAQKNIFYNFHQVIIMQNSLQKKDEVYLNVILSIWFWVQFDISCLSLKMTQTTK